MAFTILQFPTIQDFIAFVDKVTVYITDSDVDYKELTITKEFDEPIIELAIGAYRAEIIT